MSLVGHSLPLSACTSDKLHAALAYWDRARGDRPMPARADILPEQMVAFLPQAMMVRVRHDPLELHWSVFGGNHAEGAGRDYTGRPVRDIHPPELAELAWAQYVEVVAAGVPMLHCMEVRVDALVRCTRISLPLADDGVTVDRLLTVSDSPGPFWKAVRKLPQAAAS